MKIRNDLDLEFAIKLLDDVWTYHNDSLQNDLRTWLVDNIEAYEDAHFDFPSPTPEDIKTFEEYEEQEFAKAYQEVKLKMEQKK